MALPHLMEVMDSAWLPESLRATVRDALECCQLPPFRHYYRRVADEARRLVTEKGYETVVELGAGTAPVTRLLAEDAALNGTRLIVCDVHPDREAYKRLQQQYPGRVVGLRHPVDFSRRHPWPPRTLLVLSSAFHHIPPAARQEVLTNLTESAASVLVCEPLRRTWPSLLLALCSVIPGIATPIRLLHRPGRLRRVLWCWVLPAAPLVLTWDALVSCLRMWSDQQWRENLLQVVGHHREFAVTHSASCQITTW